MYVFTCIWTLKWLRFPSPLLRFLHPLCPPFIVPPLFFSCPIASSISHLISTLLSSTLLYSTLLFFLLFVSSTLIFSSLLLLSSSHHLSSHVHHLSTLLTSSYPATSEDMPDFFKRGPLGAERYVEVKHVLSPPLLEDAKVKSLVSHLLCLKLCLTSLIKCLLQELLLNFICILCCLLCAVCHLVSEYWLNAIFFQLR